MRIRPFGALRARAVVPAVIVAAATVAVFVGGAAAGGQSGHTGGFGKSDQELVAAAKASGQPQISLVMIAASGNMSSVVSGLKSLGAQIKYQDAKLGYVHALVPTAHALQASKLTGLKVVNVDRVVSVEPPDPDSGVAPLKQGREHGRHGDGNDPLPGLGPENAYMPTRDIGAPQFVRAHRTFDGRGVKVGIVDTGVDLDRPELQTALDLRGHKIPKIYDWVTTTDPALDDPGNGDPTWVPMTAVTPTGDSFTASGATFRLPNDFGHAKKTATHDWIFGVFSEGDPRLGGELGSDVNRDGDTNDSFGVLEDRATDTVWVDVGQDFSFANDKPMQDYAVNLDVNHFGHDNRSTPDVVETVPFVVQVHHPDPTVDGDAEYVNIGIVSGGHGTHVAGTVAGAGFFNGKFDGVAPGAQLAVARVCLFITGCATSAQIEAFIHLIEVDKVNEIQMSIGGLPPLNADLGDPSTEEYVVDQLTTAYGVQFFFSQGNDGPGANTAGSPGTANLAIGSGAYQSQATWTANYADTPPKQDTLWTFSSRGPNEDGTLKPNVVSPGSELSTWPAWNMSENPFAGGTGVRPYQLPPGYEMIQGTSMASPMTAGAGALLLSAALQSQVNVTTAQLRNALQSSARFIHNYQAYEQGNGLTDVGAAWDVLRNGPATPAITSTAPVNTKIMNLVGLTTGTGIYEREGWKAGDSGNRTITFRGGTGTYNVIWKGNDGSFSSPSSVTFSGGTASLSVRIGPLTEGIHSAILELDNPATAGIDYETLNTVVAAAQFASAADFQVTRSATVDLADKKSFFVNVAPGTSVLKLDEAITNGRTKLDVIDPWGDPYTLPLPCGCAEDYTNGPGTNTLAIPNPMAGVWEVDIEASRAATVPQSTASFTASVLGVTIDPASWTIPSATAGVPQSRSFTFTNTLAPFTGSAQGTAFGSAHLARPTAFDGSGGQATQQQIQFRVAAGATNLDVKIGNPADPQADLDLYLFDCSTGSCVLAGQSAGPTPNEEVRIASPNAGVYVALVDDFFVPEASMQYDYSDVFTLPNLGQVTTNDTDTLHARNSSWSATATATANGQPGAGRTLRGFVQVKSGSAVVSQAPVDVQSVTP